MKKISELTTVSGAVQDNDVLVINTSGGTRKITYAQLCMAVKGTLGIRETVESVNVTEPGFWMDAKTIADAFSQLNSNLCKNIILIKETVAMNADTTVFGNYYGYIELIDNEYAKKAKLIIPIGAVRSNITTNGYGAFLAPTYKSYIDLACKRWVVCAGTAGEYTAGFICIW